MGHLLVDGIQKLEHVEKAQVVDDFYDGLLGSDHTRPFSLDLEVLGMPAVDMSQLEEDFVEEQI